MWKGAGAARRMGLLVFVVELVLENQSDVLWFYLVVREHGCTREKWTGVGVL